MTTDTTERGLERIICAALTGHPCDPPRDNTLTEIPPTLKQVNFDELGKTTVPYGGVGWLCGSPNDYDREYCIDLEQLSTFLRITQPETAGSLSLDGDGPTRRKFLARLEREITNRGIIEVLRKGIKVVQTLSRLNRAHPKKHDVFVLDFMNDTDTIKETFADYYRTTILADETDPNKLHDLKGELDACVANYKADLDEDGQVKFKGKAKTFLRTYGFLSQILSYKHLEWEQLSIFLTFLVPRLPAPVEEDLSKGILETIDTDSYLVEKQATVKLQLPDEDAEIEPTPTGVGGRPEPELDRLSNIIRNFNELFGGIEYGQRFVQELVARDCFWPDLY